MQQGRRIRTGGKAIERASALVRIPQGGTQCRPHAVLETPCDAAINTMLMKHGKVFNISICYSMVLPLYECHRRKQV